jgi:hypothetical protein
MLIFLLGFTQNVVHICCFAVLATCSGHLFQYVLLFILSQTG